MAFSSDGKSIVSGSDLGRELIGNTVYLSGNSIMAWDVNTGKPRFGFVLETLGAMLRSCLTATPLWLFSIPRQWTSNRIIEAHAEEKEAGVLDFPGG